MSSLSFPEVSHMNGVLPAYALRFIMKFGVMGLCYLIVHTCQFGLQEPKTSEGIEHQAMR